MAASDILIYNSTNLSATITLSSLVTLTTGTANCWQGTVLNFGTPRGSRWLARLQAGFITTPTAGGTLDLYMAFSSASASLAPNFPGGATGVDGGFVGPDANPVNGIQQLEFIGSFVAAATSTTPQMQNVGIVFPKAQYGVPVVCMRTSVALVTLASSNSLTFLEIRDQSQ